MEPRSDKFTIARESSPGVVLPEIDLNLRRAETAARRATPFDQFQYIDVTFNSVANADTDIIHTLSPPTADDIDVQVVRWSFASAPAAAPVIYNDTAAARKIWGDGYIVLKCNVASAVATLLLTVRRT